MNPIDRNLLNQSLLNEASKRSKINLHFCHKLLRANFDERSLYFRNTKIQKEAHVKADLTIGADGSYSKVREQIMRKSSQEYIDDLYIELSIPPGKDEVTGKSTFALDAHHLHIEPRHSFMLIGLPNQDKSFKCTLFAPFTGLFDQLEPSKAPHEEE
ncbi:hypothetical protein DFH28DRAFT_1050382 [Melampsora americana]|nr:hypothetical protein DFH28DRAFT_1050382 [Melampsora americana]